MKKKRRKICVISSSRADYSHLHPILVAMRESKSFDLKIVVTGMHLMKKYGDTIRDFKKDGFMITDTIKVSQRSATNKDIINSMAVQMNSAYLTLTKITPDIIMILGDRYDIYPIALCAYLLNIPITHLHGGEVTLGALDDNLRHSISKLSHIHLTADDSFKKRLIKMGENPKNIHNIGSLGNLGIKKNNLSTKKQLQDHFKNNNSKYLLVSLHPETIYEKNLALITNIFKFLNKQEKVNIIFTSPNSDVGSDLLLKKIHDYTSSNDNVRFIKSAGRTLYHSLIKHAHCMIGNSSSCVIEAPYLHTPVILIGDRQKGRPLSSNIISSDYDYKSIINAYEKINNKKFINNIRKDIKYKPAKSVNNILNILEKTNLDKILYKGFYDVT